MKKIGPLFIIICFAITSLYGKTKTIEKTFPTTSNQVIELTQNLILILQY